MAKKREPTFAERVRKLVATRTSLVFVETHEEERLERILADIATHLFSQPVKFFLWSATEGLFSDTGAIAETRTPAAALAAVIHYPEAGLFLFRDLHRYQSDPLVVRMLRDVAHQCRQTYKTIFVSMPELEVPLECEKEAAILDLPLPNLAEIGEILDQVVVGSPGTSLNLGDARDDVLRSTLGLTEIEATRAFAKVILNKKTVGPEIIERLYEEKRELVRKEGILDYVPPKVQLEEIGGLAVLKEWLRQRKRFFSTEAESFGLDPPKGVLFTGISGCGKSMAVQAISSYWTMPLLRLDMNRIYGAVAGSPERSLERAIRTAEAVSPCVLWIDEIETALVGASGEGAGISTRIFSSFLTWMQEKKHIVFVAATANEIDKLPPELLRKGRFDEVFFVDLPNEKDRLEILAVHLLRRGKDPKAFDLVSAAKSTTGFNGAELEQVVLAAMYTAFDEKRELTMKDLYRSLGRMVPLSTTMAERIKEIKRWADTRALRANAG